MPANRKIVHCLVCPKKNGNFHVIQSKHLDSHWWSSLYKRHLSLQSSGRHSVSGFYAESSCDTVCRPVYSPTSSPASGPFRDDSAIIADLDDHPPCPMPVQPPIEASEEVDQTMDHSNDVDNDINVPLTDLWSVVSGSCYREIGESGDLYQQVLNSLGSNLFTTPCAPTSSPCNDFALDDPSDLSIELPGEDLSHLLPLTINS